LLRLIAQHQAIHGEATMNSRTILKLTFVFAVATAVFLLPALGSQAHAQQACATVRILVDEVLPAAHPIDPLNDTWGGDFWGTVGGEFVSGYMSGNDGTYFNHQNSNQARNGHDKFVFGAGADTFTYEIAEATFNFPPGKAAFGQYKGHGNIEAGTGRFQYATGNLNLEGPFIVWLGPDETTLNGRASLMLTGTICGIQ